MRTHGLVLAVFLLVAAAGLSACGYTFVTADAVPADVRTLRVDRVDASDGDPLLADALARELRSVVRRGGRFELVDAGPADAVLSVRVVADRERAVAFDEFDDVLDYQSTLAVDATLERPTGEVVWSGERLSSSRGHAAIAEAVVTSSSAFVSGERLRVEDLTAFDNVQLGEERRSIARDRLVADLAQTVYDGMTEGY